MTSWCRALSLASPCGFPLGLWVGVAKYFLFSIPGPSDNRGCELWTQQQMFLISHEKRPVSVQHQGPRVRG